MQEKKSVWLHVLTYTSTATVPADCRENSGTTTSFSACGQNAKRGKKEKV